MVDRPIPVSIITGFLGSGKTTLLNRLLKHPSFGNSLVIVNEFGDIGIDHLLIAAPAENLRLLSNGCLCCEVVGGFVETLADVAAKRAHGAIPAFDRVLVETSGLADPVPIIHTLVTHAELGRIFGLDAVVGVVDSVHAVTQITTQDEARQQIAVSDVLLASKTDLVKHDDLQQVFAAVRAINAGAQIIPVVHGAVDPALLFGRGACHASSGVPEVERWIASHVLAVPAGGHGIRSSSHAGDARTFTLFDDTPTTEAGLAAWFGMLAGFKGPNLLRLKGIVNVEGDPYVVHAVQTIFHEPVRLDRWPSDDRRTRIVFIGRGLDREAITRTFSALAQSKASWKRPRLDPATYEHFLELAHQFR